MKMKRSAHTIAHPYEILVETGNGWGGGEHMGTATARAYARQLIELANSIDHERRLALMTDDHGVQI